MDDLVADSAPPDPDAYSTQAGASEPGSLYVSTRANPGIHTTDLDRAVVIYPGSVEVKAPGVFAGLRSSSSASGIVS